MVDLARARERAHVVEDRGAHAERRRGPRGRLLGQGLREEPADVARGAAHHLGRPGIHAELGPRRDALPLGHAVEVVGAGERARDAVDGRPESRAGSGRGRVPGVVRAERVVVRGRRAPLPSVVRGAVVGIPHELPRALHGVEEVRLAAGVRVGGADEPTVRGAEGGGVGRGIHAEHLVRRAVGGAPRAGHSAGAAGAPDGSAASATSASQGAGMP